MILRGRRVCIDHLKCAPMKKLRKCAHAQSRLSQQCMPRGEEVGGGRVVGRELCLTARAPPSLPIMVPGAQREFAVFRHRHSLLVNAQPFASTRGGRRAPLVAIPLHYSCTAWTGGQPGLREPTQCRRLGADSLRETRWASREKRP